jgi:SAM-dependent methyltransferase
MKPDYSQLLAFYQDHLHLHKTGYKATGWGNPIIQHHNFLLATEIDGLSDGMRILDVGCGLGDFYPFLKEKGFQVEYTGIDICPNMVAMAKERHPDAAFFLADLLDQPFETSFDYVFCSGTLNLRLPDYEQWLSHMLEGLFEYCERGICFNMLSHHHAQDREDFQQAGDFYFADPGHIFALCQGLSRRVSINHSDNIETFTVYVYKEESSACKKLARSLAPQTHYNDVAQSLFSQACDIGALHWAADYLEQFATPPKGPSNQYKRSLAQLYLAQEDMVSLKTVCEQGICDDPEADYFHFCLALSHNRLGEPKIALAHAKEALALAPDNDQYLAHTVCLMIACGKRAEALKLIPKLPSAAQQAFLEGHLWHTAQVYSKARACYQRALTLSPNYTLAERCLEMLPQETPLKDATSPDATEAVSTKPPSP